jgi:hypothetical protein
MSRRTPAFAIQGSKWHISWTVAGNGYIGVSVYSESGKLVTRLGSDNAEPAGGRTGSDDSVFAGPGRFYLVIEPEYADSQSWEVWVDDT